LHDTQANSLWLRFAAFAEEAPGRPAVEAADGDLIQYGTLYRRALAIAASLPPRRNRQCVAGVLCRDGAAQAAACLATVRQGWIYAPLSVEYPLALLSDLVLRHGINVLIHDDAHARIAAQLGAERRLEVHEFQPIDPASVSPPSPCMDEPGACLMFTSGSTGQPKAVLVRQSSIVNLVHQQDYATVGPEDRLAFIANPAFDASLFELWGALLNGATLVAGNRDVLMHPDAFAGYLAGRRITKAFVTTALFNHIARHRPNAFASLDTLLFGGERADPYAVRAVLAAGGPRRLLNVYGPTECTTFATAYLVVRSQVRHESIPIGCPIRGVEAILMGQDGRTIEGVGEGELYLAGAGLASGYYRDPALTKARFVSIENSQLGSLIAYRTGDIVARDRNGVLTFVRRIDDQIKRRGYRFTLSEVDGDLMMVPGVLAAASIERQDGGGITSEIVSFIVLATPSDTERQRVFDALRSIAPAFRRPNRLIAVSELPISAHGKLDRRALLSLAESRAELQPVRRLDQRPFNARSLAEAMFARFAGAPATNDEQDFFATGGDSLAAAQLLIELESVLGRQLSYTSFLEQPTVQGLERSIRMSRVVDRARLTRTGPEGAPRRCVLLGPHGAAFQGAFGDALQVLWANPFDVGDPEVLKYATVDSHAEAYCDLLEADGDQRPLMVAGYSYGAVLGVQVAGMLERKGIAVERLVLIDPDIDACCGTYQKGLRSAGISAKLLSWQRLSRHLRILRKHPGDALALVRHLMASKLATSHVQEGKLRSRRRAILQKCEENYATLCPPSVSAPVLVLLRTAAERDPVFAERDMPMLRATFPRVVATPVHGVIMHGDLSKAFGMAAAAETLKSLL